ncbi:MAG: lysophospholipid acyltransferase family protein [Myxococcota bacterium]|jgi:1-acyl-sn-glycerol-3-phosphate acyltransferase|nr:lysophospholipid acyltransferase family protein [Myxococcota bacterium]
MKKHLARFILRILGWSVVGEKPRLQKYIIIFAPHTSNWDFVMAQMAGFALNISAKYFGKASLFRFPYRFFFEFLGGIPIDRSKHNNIVDFAVALFEQRDELVLALAPEGTRSWVDRWKTGFYHIAHGAKVPLVLCFFDYIKKEVGVAEIFNTSGDIEEDMVKIAAIYQEKSGRNPEHYNPKIY